MVAYAKREKEQQPRLTPQEYLEREREAETKSEYDNGIVTAMAGASPELIAISTNIHGRLFGQLLGKDCRPFVNDMRVRTPECDKYYYPDVSVVCGKPEYEQLAGVKSLLNPTLVIEVLSDSTEAKDRGEKLECYRTLESLNTYVLAAQDRSFVETYRRQENGWLYSSVKGLEGVLILDGIDCELKLADIYEGVELQELQIGQNGDESTAE